MNVSRWGLDRSRATRVRRGLHVAMRCWAAEADLHHVPGLSGEISDASKRELARFFCVEGKVEASPSSASRLSPCPLLVAQMNAWVLIGRARAAVLSWWRSFFWRLLPGEQAVLSVSVHRGTVISRTCSMSFKVTVLLVLTKHGLVDCEERARLAEPPCHRDCRALRPRWCKSLTRSIPTLPSAARWLAVTCAGDPMKRLPPLSARCSVEEIRVSPRARSGVPHNVCFTDDPAADVSFCRRGPHIRAGMYTHVNHASWCRACLSQPPILVGFCLCRRTGFCDLLSQRTA